MDFLQSESSGSPGGSDGKASACSVGDPGCISGLGRSPGEENGNLLQYSCLENFMDRGAWWATVDGVTKSQIWLSSFHFTSIQAVGNSSQSDIWQNAWLLNWILKCYWTTDSLSVPLELSLFLVNSWTQFPTMLQSVHESVLSCFSHVRLCVCVTLRTVACQTPLSKGFSRQEYWSGLPCPPTGYLPHPGIEPMCLVSSALAGGFFTTNTTWEAL